MKKDLLGKTIKNRLLQSRRREPLIENPGMTAVFPELSEVETVMIEALSPTNGSLHDISRQLLQNRGKMLRPLMLLLCAGLTGGAAPENRSALIAAAAAVEMIHTASLVHDDILDESSERRGCVTLHLRWDCSTATQVGDLLLARAFALLSGPGRKKELLALMSRSVSLLCRGEICQMNQKYRWEITEREYYQANYLKTAQFMASCCEAGGWAAGAAPEQRRALHDFGCQLGQAFQIVDDILDFLENPLNLGKPVGIDLGQGIATLPLIHLFKTKKHYLKLIKMNSVHGAGLPPELQVTLREAVKKNGSLEYACAAAIRAKEAAMRALQPFPQTRDRRVLQEMAEAVTGKLRPLDSEAKLS